MISLMQLVDSFHLHSVHYMRPNAPVQPLNCTMVCCLNLSQGILYYLQCCVIAVLKWRTPSAAAWSQIQTIARRAAACIQWAQSEVATMDQSQHSTLPLYNHLIHQLVMLLHDLLLGHVADPNVDLRPTFATGLVPLMHQWKAWAPSSSPLLAKLTALGSAMLQRLASYASLIQLDECDPHWWTLAAGYFGRVHSIWELLGEYP